MVDARSLARGTIFHRSAEMDDQFVKEVNEKFWGLPPFPPEEDKTPGANHTRRNISESVLDMAVHTACVVLEQKMREKGIKALLAAKPKTVTADQYADGLADHGFALFAAITGKE